MADKFIEVSFENEDEVILKMLHYEERQAEHARRILDNITGFGEHVLQSHVPVHSSYLLRHVARERARWHPGGAGGGGQYEAVVGIKRGTSRHPFYVEFGTGLYGAVGWFIVPQRMPFMYFYSTKYHRNIRASFTRGQRPQRYMYITWREMLIYARARMAASELL